MLSPLPSADLARIHRLAQEGDPDARRSLAQIRDAAEAAPSSKSRRHHRRAVQRAAGRLLGEGR